MFKLFKIPHSKFYAIFSEESLWNKEVFPNMRSNNNL